MGQVMKLGNIVASIKSFDPEDTIYATKPWGKESAAIVAREPDSGGLPESAIEHGMKYFLEIYIANDFIDDWQKNLSTPQSQDDICARVIQYAIYDA